MNKTTTAGIDIPGKAILCLIDFSEASRKALQWATEMAELSQAHLTILYSYRLLQAKAEALQNKKQKEVEALKKFLQWETEVLNNKQIRYDFRTEVGFMDDRVEAYVSKNPVSMLVIPKGIIPENNETVRQIFDKLSVPLVIVP